jgi:surface polysaccharide O-acyltransferase-like enzyme
MKNERMAFLDWMRVAACFMVAAILVRRIPVVGKWICG